MGQPIPGCLASHSSNERTTEVFFVRCLELHKEAAPGCGAMFIEQLHLAVIAIVFLKIATHPSGGQSPGECPA
jgi:hypothetical protein